ncbi:MAG: formylglycine-generating enzyme family protein, partial [Armatimonadetes bacterium]|nr:formylglycine-generating enzyme family protein [Armatimonadota bacterium]
MNPVDGAVLVWVPGTAEACPNGKFRMGSMPEEIDGLWTANGWDVAWKEFTKDEQPAHEVELDGFRLHKHEVTVGQYAKFMAATGHEAPEYWADQKGQVDLPVVSVSWDDAQAYCKWAGG